MDFKKKCLLSMLALGFGIVITVQIPSLDLNNENYIISMEDHPDPNQGADS